MRKRRFLLVAFGLTEMGALLLHRWPWRRAEPPDLEALRQRVAELQREVEAPRAAPDPTDAYTPQTPGSIADLATDLAALLRQLPGVVHVEVLVTCPQPTHRIMYVRDRHLVPRDELAIALAHEPGRPLLVALIGFGSEAVRAQALECGLDYLLVKPVDVEDLLRPLSLDRSTG
jgi:hypothetical protein